MILQVLFDLILTLAKNINRLWDWISQPININFGFKIPLIFPNGINISLGYSIIDFLGAGILVLALLWVIKSLVPLG